MKKDKKYCVEINLRCGIDDISKIYTLEKEDTKESLSEAFRDLLIEKGTLTVYNELFSAESNPVELDIYDADIIIKKAQK
jgi:hypothetical protein